MAKTTKASPKRKGSKKARRRRRRILLVIEILVLLILLAVLFVVSKLDKIQQDKDFKGEETQKNELTEQVQETLDGYTNIALFGLDSRESGNLDKGSHSDTIMVASINNKTKEVKLVSVYRDTYLNQADGKDTYHKANQAYYTGGPKQAVDMLNLNLDLQIEDYVTIDWAALVAVIDDLGGIDVDIQEDEIIHLNNYTVSVSEETGVKTNKITSPGLQTLDGVQATSYARIRYTAGDDFKRTERQRLVLTLVAEKAKKASIGTLSKIVDHVFPMIKTSLTYSEIIAMAGDATAYSIGETAGFPSDHSTGPVGKMSVVFANGLTENDKTLHEFLFDGENYTPSKEVQNINDYLIKKTGKTPTKSSGSGQSEAGAEE
ncbi:LCP family protein [Diplocloster modestus]|uniref:LCP family protein n=1 Tax=Diplocloster modestus TaxID=2850322 RepID=A0ABS6K1B4_9FIRM|nr:LCP family protein [Diplocloster modestus]MBU9724643.1 LCP family protein [Diplocloster modestus]